MTAPESDKVRVKEIKSRLKHFYKPSKYLVIRKLAYFNEK